MCSGTETRLDDRKKNLFTLKRVHPIYARSSFKHTHVLYSPEINLLLIIASILILKCMRMLFISFSLNTWWTLSSSSWIYVDNNNNNNDGSSHLTKKTDLNKNRTQISSAFPSTFLFSVNSTFCVPVVVVVVERNSTMSFENEQKSKRRSSLVRFGNRCRRMFSLTRLGTSTRFVSFHTFRPKYNIDRRSLEIIVN